MLKEYENAITLTPEEVRAELPIQRSLLEANQMKVQDAKLPVMVIIEGWGASGKGSIISKIIRNIDPRHFRVATMDYVPTDEERRRPFLHRYFVEIPAAGKFKFFDTCWMQEVTYGSLRGELSEKEYRSKIDSINMAERQLTDNGYLVLKFFLHISRKEQKKRLKRLQDGSETKWRVDKDDLWENKHFDHCQDVYERYLQDTNMPNAPWYIVPAQDKKMAELTILQNLNQGIATALKNGAQAVPIRQNIFPLNRMPKLAEIPLKGKTITDEKYKLELKDLQAKLSTLHSALYKAKIPVVIAYEGWDAAGKGGNIRRISEALDPRGYDVHPIASPEPAEKSRHYLWRFWNRLPKSGHIAIFDRTWYGRVMVERLEGFCSENDWQRAFNEMNEFEKQLVDWGAIVIKFWVQIDKETQLERFTDRQNTPEKQWKITDEDWRNREKWDLYEVAVDEMLQKTNTTFAPWYILESVDKKYARIKALKIVIEHIEKALQKKK